MLWTGRELGICLINLLLYSQGTGHETSWLLLLEDAAGSVLEACWLGRLPFVTRRSILVNLIFTMLLEEQL